MLGLLRAVGEQRATLLVVPVDGDWADVVMCSGGMPAPAMMARATATGTVKLPPIRQFHTDRHRFGRDDTDS